MSPEPRLQRRLGGFDATTVGVGSMLGAGVFVVFAPATARAGSWTLLALGVAAVIAFANASATAMLARAIPRAGGTYEYALRTLGRPFARIAGFSFLLGKVASCAAMGYTIGVYTLPDNPQLVALIALAALTVINLFGITRTATATRIIVAIVFAVLVFVAIITNVAGSPARSAPLPDTDVWGVLGGAGILFFAFAGYARIATMGEEVIHPARNIPRAIFGAFAVVLGLYVALLLGLTRVLGADLPAAAAPVGEALGRLTENPVFMPLVSGAAVLAAAGALLALLAGISRTAFAMAREGDLPSVFSRLNRHRSPMIAELVLVALVALGILFGSLPWLIALSSCAVLTYYAVTNLAALRFRPGWHDTVRRPWYSPRLLNALGLLGCVALSVTVNPWGWIAILAIIAAAVLAPPPSTVQNTHATRR